MYLRSLHHFSFPVSLCCFHRLPSTLIREIDVAARHSFHTCFSAPSLRFLVLCREVKLVCIALTNAFRTTPWLQLSLFPVICVSAETLKSIIGGLWPSTLQGDCSLIDEPLNELRCPTMFGMLQRTG